MRLTTTGSARNFATSLVGRVTTRDLPQSKRDAHVRLLHHGERADQDFGGYRAVLAYDTALTDQPVIEGLRDVLPFVEHVALMGLEFVG